MAKFILGKKLHMTQIFAEDGRVVPVTVVEAGPCTVTQIKGEKDGYSAVQVGFGNKKRTNKPLAGHLKGFDNFRYLKEFRVENTQAFAKGKVFDVSTFAVGDKLKVTATSKGKGFQGVVKRHGFHGSPASHGHKDQLRMPGSIGATDAARVFKGLRMAGRMGGDNVTVDNLELIKIDAEKNLLYVKGAVPGARNSFVILVTGGEINFVEAKKDVPVEAETKVEEVKTEVEAKEETPVEVKEETEVKDKESNIPSEVEEEKVKEDKK
ncbi:50S ribosomal protein L3 [Candidatus Parcubacteria bacterium]|nr:MAG: 50S ribosomal protein L3 [Candidatus Parcubacteria bacterium]